jgi:hypothetical protein
MSIRMQVAGISAWQRLEASVADHQQNKKSNIIAIIFENYEVSGQR